MTFIRKQILVLALFSSYHLVAQKLPFAIGPEFGLTYSKLPKYNDDVRPNDKIGIHAGVKFYYPLKEHFSLGASLLFNQRASGYQYVDKTNFFSLLQKSFGGLGLSQPVQDSVLNFSGTFINDTVYNKYSATVRLNYLEIPIAATYHFNGGFFSAGVSPCILVGSKATETLKQDVPLLDMTSKYIDSLGFIAGFIYGVTPAYKKEVVSTKTQLSAPKKFDLNCFAEFGIENTYGLQMSTRFTYGLIKTAMHEKVKANNLMAFMFSVGYMFGSSSKNNNVKGRYDLDPVEN